MGELDVLECHPVGSDVGLWVVLPADLEVAAGSRVTGKPQAPVNVAVIEPVMGDQERPHRNEQAQLPRKHSPEAHPVVRVVGGAGRVVRSGLISEPVLDRVVELHTGSDSSHQKYKREEPY